MSANEGGNYKYCGGYGGAAKLEAYNERKQEADVVKVRLVYRL